MANLRDLYTDINRLLDYDKSLQAFYLDEINSCLSDVSNSRDPNILLPRLQTMSAVITPFKSLEYITGASLTAAASPNTAFPTYPSNGTEPRITGALGGQASLWYDEPGGGAWTLGTAYGDFRIYGVSGEFSNGAAAVISTPTGNYTIVTPTDAMIVSATTLPADFGRDLFKVTIDGKPQCEVKIKQSWREIMDLYLGASQQGDVSYCCVAGNVIYLHPVPDPPELAWLRYYRKPNEVTVNDDSELSIIPTPYQRELIPFYVARNLSIADTQKYELFNQQYQRGLQRLYLAVKGEVSKQVPHITRNAQFF